MADKLEIGGLQCHIMATVRAALADRGWSARRLSEESGITRNRCNELLRDARIATIDEIDAMCSALGLVTWQVVRAAEEAVSGATDTVVAGPWGTYTELPIHDVPDWASPIAARDITDED